MSNTKIVMAIGGHVGDMELTAGATLSSMYLSGHKIITVALTAGERGNPPEQTVSDYRVQKVSEAAKFAEMIGGKSFVFDYADGELPDNEEVRFQLCDLIRAERPDLLITHWKNSIHKDHANTYKIVKDAQFFAGLRSMQRESGESCYAAGPYYAENWEDATDWKPYVYSIVSEEGFALWERAISYHWFTMNSKSYQYKEYYSHLKAVRGIEARKKYAECFNIEETGKKVICSELQF